ncbi:MAG: class I SAM-dependent RNA methyltransferase [Pseudomonadota bacterium]
MRSSKRRKPKDPCAIQNICCICPYVNQNYEASLIEKSEKDLKMLREAGLLDKTRVHRTIPSPRKLGYRTVFKLAVRKNPDLKSTGRFRLGLFDPGSHQIGPELTPCPLHHAHLRKLLKELHVILDGSALEPYDEIKKTGDVRYVIARTNQAGDQTVITWVVTHPLRDLLLDLTNKLNQRGLKIDVSAMNVNGSLGNAIWGNETVILSDKKFIEEKLAGLNLALGPTSFFQVNPWQAENIYLRIEHLARKMAQKDLAWDLFSGVGPISCVLGRVFKKTVSLEENIEATHLANKNAELNRLDNKIQVLSGLVEKELNDFPVEFQKPNLIVANPSRRGIHEQARNLIIAGLQQTPGAELIYLSCDVQSFKRDLIHFKSHGLHLSELQGFDMHAQSAQMEWLGRIEVF